MNRLKDQWPILFECLRDTIEVACEEFEENTGKQITKLEVKRIALDEKIDRKSFEYKADMTC